jgi:hypothetical protein
MTREEIVREALALSEEGWQFLHEWVNGDRPMHSSSTMTVSKTGQSDYAVAYTEWADDKNKTMAFHAGEGDTLTVYGKTYTIS